MSLNPAIVLLAAASAAFATDTTVTVRPHSRLAVQNLVGDIDVRAWGREAVRIQAAHSSRDRIVVRPKGQSLHVHAVDVRTRDTTPREVSLVLTVPRDMAVSLSGIRTSASVRDVGADVTIEVVSGGVAVEGGKGNLLISSVEGPISVTGSRGRLQVNSVSGEIRLLEIAGRILAESFAGGIALHQVVSDSVEVSTVSGTLCYDGTIREGGRYVFRTHSGDIAVGLPEEVGATVTLATYTGEIDSDFPLRVREPGSHFFQFRRGDGRALLELESFDGVIRLRRPGPGWEAGQLPCRIELPRPQEKEKRK